MATVLLHLSICLCLSLLLVSASVAGSGGILPEPEWRAIADRDLRVQPGSALDFSALFPRVPATSRIAPDAEGHLATGGSQERRVRFLCAPLMMTPPHGGFPDHARADELAREMRVRGYNLARLHFVDAALMSGRFDDFNYDPIQLDRFHYLLAAMKREGVYWLIDALSSWNGAYGDVRPHRFIEKYDLKRDVYFRPEAQDHWKKMVRTILAGRNKYTGKSMLDDPALVAVNLVNEGGLQFTLRHGLDDTVIQDIRRWASRTKRPPIDDQVSHFGQARIANQISGLFTDIETETAGWMTQDLRALGYSGLVTSYSNGDFLQAAAVRAKLDLVSFHLYHDHPTDYVKPGSHQSSSSSLDDGLGVVRTIAFNRLFGKPFILQEYDQPYWNPWRREAGLTIPAYAAFQGWDGICRFANPIELRYGYDEKAPERTKAIFPFNVGLDPIGRAGEALSALIYRRGDVTESISRVALRVYSGEIGDPRRGAQAIPDDISRIALVSRVGLDVMGAEQPSQATLQIARARTRVSMTTPVRQLTRKPQDNWRVRRDELLASGLLGVNNRTTANGSIYHSDSEQIFVAPSSRFMRIITPRTEAAVFEDECPFTLATISILACTTPALVSVSALDAQPLERSRRMLLIVATDAVNSEARFLNGRRVLVNLGHLPVRVRTTLIRLTLARSDSAALHLFALDLAGNRIEPLPIARSQGRLEFEIDTAKLKSGPAVFFELVGIAPTVH